MKVINVVLIDDERPAIRELEFLLKEYDEITIAGKFTDPFEAMAVLGEIKPHVVFLDINMPRLMGIDAGSRILSESPDTDIIFVTAYDQYAVEAFELHALDYLLKPINKVRFDKTMERLLKKQKSMRSQPSQKIQIKCLGKFNVRWEGQDPLKWRTEKTKELFAFLLHKKGHPLTKDELLDRLWTEDDPDKAIRQLYNGIYYIRKALQEYGIDRTTINVGSDYDIKLGDVNWDAEAFTTRAKKISTGSVEELEEMKTLFSGDYLEGEYFSWADAERERISKLYHQCMIKLSLLYMEKNHLDQAEETLFEAYQKDPYEEYVTELLIKLYLKKGEKNKAVLHYKSYAKLIGDELGIEPDKKLQNLYYSAI